MTSQPVKRSRFVMGMAIFGMLFGLLTIVSGGAALFYATAQEMAGNIVGFVLWFNFLAGFAYVIAGAGLLAAQRWAVWLSMAIAAGTVLVFIAFGVEVLSGRSYEMRTMIAMGFRSLVWIVTAVAAYRGSAGLRQM